MTDDDISKFVNLAILVFILLSLFGAQDELSRLQLSLEELRKDVRFTNTTRP